MFFCSRAPCRAPVKSGNPCASECCVSHAWPENSPLPLKWNQLPLNARRYLERVKELIGAPIDMVSTGPDRDHTILLRHPYR